MDIAGIANSFVSSLSMPQLPEFSLNNPYVIGLGGLFGMRLVFGLMISLILSLFTGTLSLVVAMTAQTSDTNVTSNRMRRIVIGQSLFGYLFNTVIIAAAINIVLSLGQSGP